MYCLVLFSVRSLEMDTNHTLLTIKLISLLFLDTKPPKTPDTFINVWCLVWISKIRSGESIGLVLSKFNFQLFKNAGLSTW